MKKTLQYLAGPYLAILGNTWPYLTILTLNSIHQCQTLPNKDGISWYHLVFTKHKVLLPIQLYYRHGIITIRF